MTATVSPSLDTARVLRNAADYLSRYGWHQGDYFDEWDVAHPMACPVGAMQVTICGFPAGPFTNTRVSEKQLDLLLDAVAVLADYPWSIGAVTDTEANDVVTAEVGAWNDTAGRSAAEVIAAMRHAAYRYEASRTARLLDNVAEEETTR